LRKLELTKVGLGNGIEGSVGTKCGRKRRGGRAGLSGRHKRTKKVDRSLPVIKKGKRGVELDFLLFNW